MSLVNEIQDAAISSNSSLPDLLRRCKILAARLGSAEFAAWVDRELNGYESRKTLPDYRVVAVNSFGSFSGRRGAQAHNVPIPLSIVPDEIRDSMAHVYLMDPISSYEDSIRHGDAYVFQCPWPGDLVAGMQQRILSGMTLIGAYQQLPRGAVVSLVDTVRNRVLSFVLEIEKVIPAAANDPRKLDTISPERVHQVIQTHIYGGVTNYAVGSSKFTQNVTNAQGDERALREALLEIGLAENEIAELRAAIADDAKTGAGIGRRVSQWLGKAITKSGEGLSRVTVQTASTVLPRIIANYLGLPPA